MHLTGNIDDLIVVKIKPRHRQHAFWLLRLFLNRQCAAIGINLDNAVALRVFDIIGKDFRAMCHRARSANLRAQAGAIEDIVAKRQSARLIADKILADQECFGEAARFGLRGIGEIHANARAIAQQVAKRRLRPRRRDDQNIANTGQHQCADRVVDHRFVIDWKQLLRHRGCERFQPRSGAAGQDDSLHRCFPFLCSSFKRLAPETPQTRIEAQGLLGEELRSLN